MPDIGINPGAFPALAFGTSPFAGIYNPVDQAGIDLAVETAIGRGITLFDVAPFYGETRAETALGAALHTVPRSLYRLATKVGRYGEAHWDFSRDATLASLDASLKRLKTDYIDILQCHDIDHGDRRDLIEHTLPALRELKSAGVIGAIGLTGYDLDTLEHVAISQAVDTVMAFCSFTLQDRRLASTAARLSEAGIAVLNASPLAMGLLVDGPPPGWHPAPEAVKRAAATEADLCRRAGVSLARLALQFSVRNAGRAAIATTVVGMSSAEDVIQNLEACASPIDERLLAAVEAVFAEAGGPAWPRLAARHPALQ